MSLQRIEQTILWKNTLSEKDNDEYKRDREKLRSSLLSMRDKTNHLVSKISSAIPNLTQHETSHLDALWETSDLLIDSNFELNPLEAYVLGAAILIHDSCLCFEAFDKGKIGLRDTVEWKDIYSSLKEEDQTNENIDNDADFFCLRLLHAKQAESLLNKYWIDPDDQGHIYILDDYFLRKHLSNIIGLIASSHHWDIETLTNKLPSQINSLSGFPREWRIDSVKIACVLRCADAIHIDNERAPDFLYALLKRSGVSFNHWQGQNRMSSADYDTYGTDPDALIFNSTFNFKENESKSWYIIYDTLCLIDKEIKSSNVLLKEKYNITLRAKKVKGVESPEELSKYIKAEGWSPCSAKIHVNNIQKIIENLGGEMLYGKSSDLLGVVIRELIQNSRDSINARKIFDNNLIEKIKVIVHHNSEGTWITIEDNGIGMSERVLTGPLLDFGTSFWSSNMVREEFPGLKSSHFKSVGKFGIGFYSIFMIAKKAYISTRNWKEGINDLKHLKFEDGFSLRPILSKGELSGFDASCSTQIKILLKEGFLERNNLIEIKSNYQDSINLDVYISDYICALAGGLDCDIYYKDDLTETKLIHQSINSNKLNIEDWINKISFSNYQNNQKLDKYISKNWSRLKPIISGNKTYGLAAINTFFNPNSHDYLSLSTIGGLATSVHSRQGSSYIGYIDFKSNSAKRDINGKCYSFDKETLNKWLNEQYKILSNEKLDGFERYIASSSFAEFKYDPTDIAAVMTNLNGKSQFMDLSTIIELSKKIGIVFLESRFQNIDVYNEINNIPNLILIKSLGGSIFTSLKMKEGIPENNFSILDCLYRLSIKKGYTPTIIRIESNFKNIHRDKLNLLIFKSS